MALTWLLTAAAILSGLLHIRADYAGARTQTYLFKPLTMLLIVAYLFALGTPENPSYRTLILAGLACSLVGDIFLMLPTKPLAPGLASFLIAHLFYASAFLGAAPVEFNTPQITLGVFGIAAGAGLMIILWQRAGKLRIPVIGYACVIGSKCWLALNVAVVTGATEAWLGFAGSLLFVFSDSVLSINRIVRPFHAAQALILGSYYPAQWLIASSLIVTTG